MYGIVGLQHKEEAMIQESTVSKIETDMKPSTGKRDKIENNRNN